MTRNNKSIDLMQLYNLLSCRIDKEIEELYTIHKVYLIISGALIAGITANYMKFEILIIGGILGVILSIFWMCSIKSQEKWKDYWIIETANIEKLLSDNDNNLEITSWQKAARFDNVSTFQNQPPEIKKVSNPMHWLYCIMGIISLLSMFYGIFLGLKNC